MISAAANPGSHTVRVEVDLDPFDGLFSGRFARLRMPAGKQQALLIPSSSLIREGDLTYVWRVSSGGMLSKAPVELGDSVGENLMVIRGLSEGDRVVVEPSGELYPGARVE